MAPCQFIFPTLSSLLPVAYSLLLLAYGPVACSVLEGSDVTVPPSATARNHQPLPPSPLLESTSDPVVSDRKDPGVTYNGPGRDKVPDDDDWMAPWSRRKRRGKTTDGALEASLSPIATVVAPRNSCKDLRSKRYISDGFCTSSRPLTEAVCADKCCSTPSSSRQRLRGRNSPKYRQNHPSASVPMSGSQSDYRLQPWFPHYVKVWARGQNEMNSVIAGEVGGVIEDDEVGDGGGVPAGTLGVEEHRVEWRCVEDAVRRRRVRLLCRDGSRRTYIVRLVKSCKCVQRRRQKVAEKRRRRGRGRRRGRRKMARGGGGWRRARWAVD